MRNGSAFLILIFTSQSHNPRRVPGRRVGMKRNVEKRGIIMRILLTLTGALMLTGAAVSQPSKEAQANPAVGASNAFACDLFKKLDETNRAKNIFFSPYSISTALAM